LTPKEWHIALFFCAPELVKSENEGEFFLAYKNKKTSPKMSEELATHNVNGMTSISYQSRYP
jgi:hypothetical protein